MGAFYFRDLQDLLSRRCTVEELDSLPERIHAELINGFIYIGEMEDDSPPRRIHQEISGELFCEIHNYIKRNNISCKVYAAPFAVRFSENDSALSDITVNGNDSFKLPFNYQTLFQPDITVICDKSKLTENGCEGTPDFIIEISSSYAYNDYVVKYDMYKMYGVREYWIVNPTTKTVTVCIFDGTEPENTEYKFNDTVTARIFKDTSEPFKICIADLISDY